MPNLYDSQGQGTIGAIATLIMTHSAKQSTVMGGDVTKHLLNNWSYEFLQCSQGLY